MFPSPEDNGYVKKRSYTVNSLVLQDFFGVCCVHFAVVFWLLFPQISPLQNFSLPVVLNVWTLSSLW